MLQSLLLALGLSWRVSRRREKKKNVQSRAMITLGYPPGFLACYTLRAHRSELCRAQSARTLTWWRARLLLFLFSAWAERIWRH